MRVCLYNSKVYLNKGNGIEAKNLHRLTIVNTSIIGSYTFKMNDSQ